MNFKDIAMRSFKTFIQGFLGALAVTLPSSDLSQGEVVRSLLIGAVAGGISALMNFVIGLLDEESKKKSEGGKK